MNLEQREEIRSEVEDELNVKLDNDGKPLEADPADNEKITEEELSFGDIVTENPSGIEDNKEDRNIKITEEEERHEMQ